MQLSYRALPLTLREPFVTHNGARSGTISHIQVEIAWGGHVGYGIAVPSQKYGTTMESVTAALAECAKLLAHASPFRLEAVNRRLAAAIPGQACAIAAVDMALYDILGKSAGLPLHRLLGLEGLSLPPTGLSLSIGDLRETVAKARRYAHWPILKLKMSAPNDELVRRVRDVFHGKLWIDANGAWNAWEALDTIARFHRYGVDMIEQPVAPRLPDQLRFVHERSPVPIMADEDSVGPRDVPRLAGCASAIAIKLVRCGGISRALDMIRAARSHGLKVMLGCVTESALGVTAIAQLAGLADFLDADGHIDLLDDPFEGLSIEQGRVILPVGPGLGVSRRQEAPPILANTAALSA